MSLTKTLAFSALALFIALCLSELSWRFYLFNIGKGFFDDPREFTSPFFTTYEEPRPFITNAGFEFHNGTVSLNRSLYEIRIICFGGSTTVNARAGISYAAILEKKFTGGRDKYVIRVLNAGGDGYSTAHTLVNFSLRNLEVRPDIIVVYHNINDLTAASFGHEVMPDYANKYKTDFYLGFRHRTGPLAELTKISRLARFLFSKIMAIKFPKYQGDHRRDHIRGLGYFKRNLRSIVAIAKAHGIRVVLASQAARSDFRTNETFVAYNEGVKTVAAEEDVVFVDIANSLTNDDFFLEDSLHYTRAGVEGLAEEFYGPLRKLVDEVLKEKEGNNVMQ